MAGDHRATGQLATASLIELISRGQALQAAVIRGDKPEAIERLRLDALDVATAYLDLTMQAAVAVRSIIEP
jgi:hypothetical protein